MQTITTTVPTMVLNLLTCFMRLLVFDTRDGGDDGF